jgi:hypothetical protein
MLPKQKIILSFLIISLGVIILVFFSPKIRHTGTTQDGNAFEVNGSQNRPDYASSIPMGNAFLPDQPPYRNTEIAQPANPLVSDDIISSITNPFKIFSQGVSGISLNFDYQTLDVADGVLDLPEVKDNELTIGPSGPKNVLEYFTYLSKNYQSIDFSYAKLSEVETGNDGTSLSPFQIVKMNLDNPHSPNTGKSLAILRELISKKIEFEKEMPVADQAITINKKVIGLDTLSLRLIDSFYDFRDGKIGRAEIENFLAGYENTGNFYANQFIAGGMSNMSSLSNDNMFSKVKDFLGIKDAYAQTFIAYELLGGKILIWSPCTCVFTLGQGIVVGPPNPGTFFVPPTADMYPFLFQELVPTACILGIATPLFPVPCLQQGPGPVCIPVPPMPPEPGAFVIMAGTSAPGCAI